MKVFIVEDNLLYSTLLQEELTRQGYDNIHCYTNAEDCLDDLWKMPEVIFMDYNLEQMNGVEALRRIMAFNPDTQVIFLSGQDSMDVAIETLKYGAFDYVVKDDHTFNRLAHLMNNVERMKTLVSQTRGKERKNIMKYSALVGLIFCAGILIGMNII